jgi:hypothetical protein
MISDNICVIFNDLLHSTRLNVIDLAAGKVRRIDADFLALFDESRLSTFEKVQEKLTFMLNQKIFKNSMAETIEDFPIDEWKKLKTTGATLISFKV